MTILSAYFGFPSLTWAICWIRTEQTHSTSHLSSSAFRLASHHDDKQWWLENEVNVCFVVGMQCYGTNDLPLLVKKGLSCLWRWITTEEQILFIPLSLLTPVWTIFVLWATFILSRVFVCNFTNTPTLDWCQGEFCLEHLQICKPLAVLTDTKCEWTVFAANSPVVCSLSVNKYNNQSFFSTLKKQIYGYFRGIQTSQWWEWQQNPGDLLILSSDWTLMVCSRNWLWLVKTKVLVCCSLSSVHFMHWIRQKAPVKTNQWNNQ